MLKKIYFMMIALCMSTVAMAQVTTSSLNGKVTDASNGEALAGAIIKAVHVPTGTSYGISANTKGQYTIQGMRPGGPYQVTISYIGKESKTFQIKSLALGESYEISAQLADNSKMLDNVVVTAKRNTRGEAVTYDNMRIQMAPTINRNVQDIAKQNPMVNSSKYGGISIAGSNNRYNSFQIDGTISNDVFGLTPQGTNGGQSNALPISLDAIDQLQVSVAPFDVRQSGFTGGAINVVTKSGTNEFHGSAFGFYNNQDMYGRYNAVQHKNVKMSKQFDENFGATIGGPIIKDKLFFFASAEYKKNSYPSSWYPGVEGYFSENQIKGSALQYETMTGIKESYGKKDIVTQGLSLLGRIDWNIDTNNKLSFRYQYNGSSQDKGTNSKSSFYFNNSGYKQTNRTHSFVTELHSKISNALSNEARVSYTRVRDWRDTPYQGPTAYIVNAKNEAGDRVGSINIGTEYSSGVNSLDQDVWTIEDNLSWYLGNHTLTFGTHNEFYNMKNGFIQYANGEYYYDGIDAFLNNNASKYYYNFSDESIAGTTRWRSNIKTGLWGLYAQDKWNLNNRLQLTYGLRFDLPTYFNSPTTNEAFNEWAANKNLSARVGKNPSANVLVSPRVGFRWYTDDSKQTVIRGGSGIFTGRVPFVWLCNMFGNTGMEMKSVTLYNAPDHKINEWQDQMESIRDKVAAGTLTSGGQTINTVSKNFRFPQVWRNNLAVEHDFGGGWKGIIEGLYSKNLHAVYFENLALTPDDATPNTYLVPGVEASKVPYYKMDAGAYSTIINLRSIDKGYSYSVTGTVQKTFDFGLDLTASYTFGHAKAVNDGLSSVANSNWRNYVSVDVNKPSLSYSMFDVPHQVKVVALYHTPKYLSGKLNTEVGLTYYGNTGMRYSLTMAESTSGVNKKSINGDGTAGHTLLYIPTDEQIEMMTWKSDGDKNNFKNWCATDKYAKKHRGEFAKRFGAMAPWEDHFDLHLAENFFYNKKGGKVTLSLDITNFANLLNRHWGVYYSSTTSLSPLKVESVAINGNQRNVTKYSFSQSSAKPAKNDIYSRWHAQVGLKVTF